MLTNQNIRKASSSGAAAKIGSAGGSDDKEQSGAPGPRKGVRMLVVLNNRRSIDGGLLFLERRGYQITVVNRISEAIQNLQIFKPHAILMSWNLKGSDVKKTYKVLTEKFKVVCIVFAEDNSTRTTASLMSSGIPHSLLSPVSGPSIHMRVQALLRQKVGVKEKRKRQVAEYGMMEVLKERAPPDIQWEQVPDPQGGDVPVWQGKSKIADEKTYYFKGLVAPKFDLGKGSWTYNDGEKDVGAVIMKGVGRRQSRSAVQEGIGQGQDFEVAKDEPNSDAFEMRQGSSKTKKAYTFETEAAAEAPELQATAASGQGEDLAAVTERKESPDFSATSDGPQSAAFSETEVGLGKNDLGSVIETGDGDLAGGSIEAGALDLDDEDFDWEAALSADTNKELGDVENQMREAFAADAAPTDAAREADTIIIPPEATGLPAAIPEKDEAAEKQAQRLKAGSDSLLFKVVKSTANKMFHADSDINTEALPMKVELVNYMQPIVVKSAHFKGVLYAVSAVDQDLESVLLEFAQNIGIAINEMGENGIVKVLPRFRIEPLPFNEFFKNTGDFVLQLPHGNDCVGLGFINVAQVPKVDDAGEPEVLAVSLETDISPGRELLFDLFIHLPRNNKFILYMNKGHTLGERTVAKFLGFGIKSVHIRKKEKDLFLTYWARNIVKALRS